MMGASGDTILPFGVCVVCSFSGQIVVHGCNARNVCVPMCLIDWETASAHALICGRQGMRGTRIPNDFHIYLFPWASGQDTTREMLNSPWGFQFFFGSGNHADRKRKGMSNVPEFSWGCGFFGFVGQIVVRGLTILSKCHVICAPFFCTGAKNPSGHPAGHTPGRPDAIWT